MKLTDIIKNNSALLGALTIGALALCINLTSSPLWVDEVVEYYYSKVMSGPVPDSESLNMYQRICETFQPPLYNIIMYIWLSIYDAEWWFKLFGVLSTLLGAIAIYKCILLTTNKKVWSSVCMLIYIMTPCIYYYGLECAEYNLMLAFICWSLLYFIKAIKNPQKLNYGLFCVFATLAIYSQYGAALLEIPLFIALFIKTLKSKQSHLIKAYIGYCCLCLVLAGIPLLYYFLIPQLTHMGSTTATHSLIFAYGNIFTDYYTSTLTCLEFVIDTPRPLIYILISILYISVIITIFKRPDNTIKALTLAAICTWFLYYLLVASGWYGYQSIDKLGTQNIGGRHSLFLVPIFEIILFIGLFYITQIYSKKNIQRILNLCSTAIASLFIILFVYKIIQYGKKEDVRDIVNIWSTLPKQGTPTFIDNWEYGGFLYYLNHNECCNTTEKDNIIFEYFPKNKKQFDKILQNDSLYLIIRGVGINTSRVTMLNQYGYKDSIIYDGISKLYFLKRQTPPNDSVKIISHNTDK